MQEQVGYDKISLMLVLTFSRLHSRSPKGRRKVEPEEPDAIVSTVTEMDKEAWSMLLESADVEADPVPPMSVEQLEYGENISDWIALVHSWLDSN